LSLQESPVSEEVTEVVAVEEADTTEEAMDATEEDQGN